jgi:hypothetical protein
MNNKVDLLNKYLTKCQDEREKLTLQIRREFYEKLPMELQNVIEFGKYKYNNFQLIIDNIVLEVHYDMNTKEYKIYFVDDDKGYQKNGFKTPCFSTALIWFAVLCWVC